MPHRGQTVFSCSSDCPPPSEIADRMPDSRSLMGLPISSWCTFFMHPAHRCRVVLSSPARTTTAMVASRT